MAIANRCSCLGCRHPDTDWTLPGEYAVVSLRQNPMKFTVWHPSRESAEKEAERLALKENAPFAVVYRIGICVKAPLVVWDRDGDPPIAEMPF